MLQVIKNLLGSEKAVTTGVLVVAASVLTALGHMTIEQWIEYTQIMAGIYVGGKAVHGAAQAIGEGMGNKAQAELEKLRATIGANNRAADERAGELPAARGA